MKMTNYRWTLCTKHMYIQKYQLIITKIWKPNVSLKTLTWYLYKVVLLTKDNSLSCMFVSSLCPVIQVASNMYPSHSVAGNFENFMHIIDYKYQIVIFTLFTTP